MHKSIVHASELKKKKEKKKKDEEKVEEKLFQTKPPISSGCICTEGERKKQNGCSGVCRASISSSSFSRGPAREQVGLSVGISSATGPFTAGSCMCGQQRLQKYAYSVLRYEYGHLIKKLPVKGLIHCFTLVKVKSKGSNVLN